LKKKRIVVLKQIAVENKKQKQGRIENRIVQKKQNKKNKE
jgi:hypothetical protein